VNPPRLRHPSAEPAVNLVTSTQLAGGSMVDYQTKAPGVYFENITPAGPIAGAGTSAAALIGEVASVADSDVGVPVLVTNWTAYITRFGGYAASKPLPYAVRGFFENGGTQAYIVPFKAALDLKAVRVATDALSRVGEVSLVCLPGIVDVAMQQEILRHCDELTDRFAILDGDPDPSLQPNGKLKTQRGKLDSALGYGALYWPWIVIADPESSTGQTVAVAPAGHVAGVMARCDDTVGVHKAPANEVVKGSLGVAVPLNDAEQGDLNSNNINAIRVFPGRPPAIWGARTLTADTNWRYVNVRRLVCYIEDSLRQGLRWAVMQPSNSSLWKGLERSISDFLTRIWQSGGLFGAKAADAFYVKIDEELNPPDVQKLGEVIVEIGIAPTRPAEYIVLRLGLWDGGATISET
jgi:phage tail sheath protein FI